MKKKTLLPKKFKTNSNFVLEWNMIPKSQSLSWTNIVHVTTGASVGKGGRLPGVWFWGRTLQLYVCVDTIKKDNECVRCSDYALKKKVTSHVKSRSLVLKWIFLSMVSRGAGKNSQELLNLDGKQWYMREIRGILQRMLNCGA